MKNKARGIALGILPLVIIAVGIAYTPGTTNKVMQAWAFALGIFAGAYGSTMLRRP